MRLSLSILIVTISIFFSTGSSAQDTILHQGRKDIVLITSTASVYSGTMAALYSTWYSQYEAQPFDFFNDRKEWRGMDKIGHFTTSWWASQWINESLKLSGYSHRKARLWGTIVPLTFLTTVEVFDGFSSGWGFSYADMLANVSGSAFFLSQDVLFAEQRFLLKYSFRKSGFSSIRPELLGSSYASAMLKDYNGQIYWLSVPLKSIVARQSEKFPGWLCLSLGYGAGGMLGGHDNLWSSDNMIYDYRSVKRHSEWYLSFDIDLKKLPIRGKAWKFFSSTFGFLKIPAPAFYWSGTNGFRFHPIYW